MTRCADCGRVGEPMRWPLEVCRTCGRRAVWPGCEHWQSSPDWCMTITVRTTKGQEAKLREEIRRRREG